MMKGVILAGGYGTRLRPATKVTNKHLLLVYDRPMIYYPLQTLQTAGINDVMIVTGGENAGDFLRLLGSGRELGLRVQYTYQEDAGGIAAALKLTEEFVGDERVCVILGDNITDANLSDHVQKFENDEYHRAKIFVKEVPDPERYGIAEICGGQVERIIEKPKNPKTKLAVTGIYMYDQQIWDAIKTRKPSSRGELEITDVNMWYINKNFMGWGVLNGYWMDAGTFDGMLEAANYMSGSS